MPVNETTDKYYALRSPWVHACDVFNRKQNADGTDVHVARSLQKPHAMQAAESAHDAYYRNPDDVLPLPVKIKPAVHDAVVPVATAAYVHVIASPEDWTEFLHTAVAWLTTPNVPRFMLYTKSLALYQAAQQQISLWARQSTVDAQVLMRLQLVPDFAAEPLEPVAPVPEIAPEVSDAVIAAQEDLATLIPAEQKVPRIPQIPGKKKKNR